MPVYVLRFLDGRPDERVGAEWCRREGSFWVLRCTVLVLNLPRDVVVRRISVAEVLDPVTSS